MGELVVGAMNKIKERIEELSSSQYTEDDLIRGKGKDGKPTFTIKVK